MIKLNLDTTDKSQEIIKKYLEENASETLANKINNGVKIEKFFTMIVNKKDLKGFFEYANSEARKLAEQGRNYACIEDKIVFGWAIHYFEEDSIEGKLYNLDGSEYKPPKQATKSIPKATPPTATKTSTKKNSNIQQTSLFDFIETEVLKEPAKEDVKEQESFDEIAERLMEEENERLESLYTEQDNIDNAINGQVEINGEVINFEDFDGDIEESPNKAISPFYKRYLDTQNAYNTSVVAYRLGDFYEIFGEHAIEIADLLDLTLTGRDCGLDARVPMIGFPYHCTDMYFKKINEKYDLVIIESEKDKDTRYLPKTQPISSESNSFDTTLVNTIKRILGDIVEVMI